MIVAEPYFLRPSPPSGTSLQRTRHLQELTDRYFIELGGNAYAAFNAITDFASHPPTNRLLRRDRHSLQRLAGHWLADFTKQCRTPDFNFSSYVEKFNATLNTRASLS